MGAFCFPEIVRIQLVRWDQERTAAALPGVIFQIHVFARQRNDYLLAPFFSNEMGLVEISRADLESAVEVQLAAGLMDYVGITGAFPLVEMRHWSQEDIDRAIQADNKRVPVPRPSAAAPNLRVHVANQEAEGNHSLA